MTVSASPFFNVRVELLPPAQIEISNTEIRAIGNLDGFAQGRQERLFYVVEDTRHGVTRILFFRLCDNAKGLMKHNRSFRELGLFTRVYCQFLPIPRSSIP